MLRLIAPCLLGMAGTLAADVVFLKSGQRLEGDLTEKGGAYGLKTDLGSVELAKADIQRVVRSPDVIVREAEEVRTRARALYDEAP